MPPEPAQIIHLMYQFIDNLNFKISISKTQDEVIEALVFAHYEFVRIHPINNANGRTGRLLMNLVTMNLVISLWNFTKDKEKVENFIFNQCNKQTKGISNYL